MITAERLRELLHYDPETGRFTWLVNRRRVKAGDIAGSLDKVGYWILRIDQRNYPAHRVAWFYMTGTWPIDQIDHRDLDKGNNRWTNLREADNGQNSANRTKYRCNKSGFKGVFWHEKDRRWRADIRKNGKGHFLGNYLTPEDAYEAYCAAAAELHGEFARVA